MASKWCRAAAGPVAPMRTALQLATRHCRIGASGPGANALSVPGINRSASRPPGNPSAARPVGNTIESAVPCIRGLGTNFGSEALTVDYGSSGIDRANEENEEGGPGARRPDPGAARHGVRLAPQSDALDRTRHGVARHRQARNDDSSGARLRQAGHRRRPQSGAAHSGDAGQRHRDRSAGVGRHAQRDRAGQGRSHRYHPDPRRYHRVRFADRRAAPRRPPRPERRRNRGARAAGGRGPRGHSGVRPGEQYNHDLQGEPGL